MVGMSRDGLRGQKSLLKKTRVVFSSCHVLFSLFPPRILEVLLCTVGLGVTGASSGGSEHKSVKL